jgi:hypothetical protein
MFSLLYFFSIDFDDECWGSLFFVTKEVLFYFGSALFFTLPPYSSLVPSSVSFSQEVGTSERISTALALFSKDSLMYFFLYRIPQWITSNDNYVMRSFCFEVWSA